MWGGGTSPAYLSKTCLPFRLCPAPSTPLPHSSPWRIGSRVTRGEGSTTCRVRGEDGRLPPMRAEAPWIDVIALPHHAGHGGTNPVHELSQPLSVVRAGGSEGTLGPRLASGRTHLRAEPRGLRVEAVGTSSPLTEPEGVSALLKASHAAGGGPNLQESSASRLPLASRGI